MNNYNLKYITSAQDQHSLEATQAFLAYMSNKSNKLYLVKFLLHAVQNQYVKNMYFINAKKCIFKVFQNRSIDKSKHQQKKRLKKYLFNTWYQKFIFSDFFLISIDNSYGVDKFFYLLLPVLRLALTKKNYSYWRHSNFFLLKC